MSVFSGGIGYGAYSNGFGAMSVAEAQAKVNKVCSKSSPDYDEFDCVFAQTDLQEAQKPGSTSMTGEESARMQVEMAYQAGVPRDELQLDPEWARLHLSKNWFERLTMQNKILFIGASVTGAIALIWAVKNL